MGLHINNIRKKSRKTIFGKISWLEIPIYLNRFPQAVFGSRPRENTIHFKVATTNKIKMEDANLLFTNCSSRN